MRITYLKTGKEWIYKSFTLYLVLIILISIILTILGYFFNDSYVYLEIIGFIGISIEAAVPIPQAICNYKNKSVKGFSKLVLIVWFTGDICKVCYHGFMHTPHQFFLCGLFQLCMDVVITSQWLYYSGSGIDWYDCYARKYGLYYVNEDMVDDDDEYSNYSYDNNSYQRCNTSSSSSSSGNGDYGTSSEASSRNSSPSPTLKLNVNDGNGEYALLKNKDDDLDSPINNTKIDDSKSLVTNNSLIQNTKDKPSSTKINDNLLFPNYPLHRRNSQSSISTFFSSADEAAGNDGDIEKESDGEEQKLFAVPSPNTIYSQAVTSPLSHSNYIETDYRINNHQNETQIVSEDLDYEQRSTVQPLNSSLFTNIKDANRYNYISDYSSDIDPSSPLTPSAIEIPEDAGSLTDPSNKKRSKRHHHHHHHRNKSFDKENIDIDQIISEFSKKQFSEFQHHHSNNSSTVKSKHSSSLSTKKSKENYGIDKSIFEYLQDGYGKLNPRLNEISFNNKASTMKATTNTLNTKKSNNISTTTNNDIMIPIPDNNIIENKSNNNNDNNNPSSPSKKLISDIVKKTFENIVGKKKNFNYNQLGVENGNDIELDSYDHSNQYCEQESANSLINNKSINNGKLKENLSKIKVVDNNNIKSNTINDNKCNVIVSDDINNNTISNQPKENSYINESTSISKLSIASTSNSNVQTNVGQNKTTNLSHNKNLHIQTQIKTNNDTITGSATTPYSSIKSSALSSIISHTKPLGVATSKLISSSSAVINNTLQSTKRAKAKANAEAAFQAEIDIAFDGDDFDRDIREGIGFNSIKNKSYNRKKEFDDNISGYSSTASVDSSIEIQGQGSNFTNRLKNWTGFAINEVDYSENEPKTPK